MIYGWRRSPCLPQLGVKRLEFTRTGATASPAVPLNLFYRDQHGGRLLCTVMWSFVMSVAALVGPRDHVGWSDMREAGVEYDGGSVNVSAS
jgi:hypothetical protein